MRVCGEGGCTDFMVAGDKKVLLCEPGLFDVPSGGWGFTGTNTGPADDCFFGVTDRTGGTFDLIRKPRSFNSEADRVHLHYSYRFDPSAFDGPGAGVDVAVRAEGGAWTTVRLYPRSRQGHAPLPDDERIRTEHVALPSFDGKEDLQVRFRTHGVDPAFPAGFAAFRTYDVVFGGRGAP